ncbi:MAG: hypothetical protein WC722_00730 [Rhodospirillales bacterium]|jgi:hypothetical protein
MADALYGALARAIQILQDHEAVESVEVGEVVDGFLVVNALFRVSMPSRWLAAGRSPTGVLPVEPVILRFPSNFPLLAPKISLRMDFDRSHPHITPGSADKPPVPCLIEGRISEFMQVAGFVGVVNQISEWLNHAAEGSLIKPEQGWEPVRRDDVPHFIAADANFLRGKADGTERHHYIPFVYARWKLNDEEMVDGWLSKETTPISEKLVPRFFSEEAHNKHFSTGFSIALLVTPGKLPNGAMKQVGTYLPETVSTIAELRVRAEEYGCANALAGGLLHLSKSLAASGIRNYRFPIPIILMAARPYNLIGYSSPIELVPYIIMGNARKILPDDEKTAVIPTGLLDALTPELLRRLSGVNESGHSQPWTLFGAGSLGSHIALSMGRMGDAPGTIVDRDILSPHNAARYALVPTNYPSSLMNNKAVALQEAIGDLKQQPSILTNDIQIILSTPDLRRQAIPKDTWAIVDTTGSLTVRDKLLSEASGIKARVIEGGLYGSGAAAILTIEGPDHNPSVGDLVGTTYELARHNTQLKAALFPDRAAHQRWNIGQGCGSLTMALPDATVSLFSSSMALAIADLRRDGLPSDGGQLLLGLRDGIQVQWRAVSVPPVKIVAADDGMPWTIRVSDKVDKAIAAEVAQHPKEETGGFIMGRISEASGTIFVTGLLPAPEDSTRSAGKFELGKKGVRKAIEAYSTSSGGSLYCLGTWHSHLAPSGPSSLDRLTASIIERGRIAPSALLIHTPIGYRALVTGET